MFFLHIHHRFVSIPEIVIMIIITFAHICGQHFLLSTDSSIGGLVTHSLRHLLILEHKGQPLRPVTLRHLIRIMNLNLNNILTIFNFFENF